MTYNIDMQLDSVKNKFVLYKGDYKDKIANVYIRKEAFRKPGGPYPNIVTITLNTREDIIDDLEAAKRNG